MNTSAQITAELNRHTAEMSHLVEALQEQIRKLPDNPRIKRLSTKCFTMSWSNVGSNWSAEHHDFRKQYELLTEMIRKASPDRAVAIIRDAVETGKIRPYDGPGGTVSLHQDVIGYLRTLLPV